MVWNVMRRCIDIPVRRLAMDGLRRSSSRSKKYWKLERGD